MKRMDIHGEVHEWLENIKLNTELRPYRTLVLAVNGLIGLLGLT